MKSLIAILIYLGTFMGMFLVMSLIGLLWMDSYHSIISDNPWFVLYTIFFGWWLAMLPTREYYIKHHHYFKEAF
jgi:H+/Cl- antiporter ClcA